MIYYNNSMHTEFKKINKFLKLIISVVVTIAVHVGVSTNSAVNIEASMTEYRGWQVKRKGVLIAVDI